MKVFISGPMSDKPYDNRAAFYKAQEELEKHGYSVWNPAWLAYPNNTEFTKDDMHIIDFAALRRCDAIYMLKGWKHSKGAQEEHEYAIMRGLMIMYEGVHCWGKEPVFDQEFAYNEAVKNRTNYQLEAIKGNIRAKYAELKNIIENLDISIGNESDRINSLEDEVEAIKESIGTDNLQEQLEKDFADVYEEFQTTKDKVNDIEFGYIDWSSKMSSAINEMEKIKNSVNDIRSIVNSSDIQNISIKAMNDRMNLFAKELDSLSTAIDIKGKDIESIVQKRCNDNRTINNTLNDLNIRLKAVEKRLSIKPFYGPDEDDD